MDHMIPLWVVFGTLGVLVSSAMPLVQEKRRADGYALALWNKIFTALLTLPFVLYYGLPSDPVFHLTAIVTGALWCAADIVYFRTIPVAGAGVVTRLIPATVILTFLLWFVVDPALLHKYMQHPAQTGVILLILLIMAYLATRIKKCEVSWNAIRMLMPLFFAATVGPVIQKTGLAHADAAQAPYAFAFVQAAAMAAIMSVYYAIRRPVSVNIFFSRHTWITGFLVSLSSGTAVVLRNFAFLHVENPAYLSALFLTDSFVIWIYHKLTGRKDGSDVAAGLGIVICAITLVIVKSLK